APMRSVLKRRATPGAVASLKRKLPAPDRRFSQPPAATVSISRHSTIGLPRQRGYPPYFAALVQFPAQLRPGGVRRISYLNLFTGPWKSTGSPSLPPGRPIIPTTKEIRPQAFLSLEFGF